MGENLGLLVLHSTGAHLGDYISGQWSVAHTRLTALCPGLPSRYQKGKTNLDFTEAREWVAVASAGLYASLHLAPDRQPHHHSYIFYRPDALPAAQPTVVSRNGSKMFINQIRV